MVEGNLAERRRPEHETAHEQDQPADDAADECPDHGVLPLFVEGRMLAQSAGNAKGSQPISWRTKSWRKTRRVAFSRSAFKMLWTSSLHFWASLLIST